MQYEQSPLQNEGYTHINIATEHRRWRRQEL